MYYQFNSNYTSEWSDEFCGILHISQQDIRQYSLSKGKLLKYFSELNTLNELHTFILDHLSKIEQVTYYMDISCLDFKLNDTKGGFRIRVEFRTFTDIFMRCAIK